LVLIFGFLFLRNSFEDIYAISHVELVFSGFRLLVGVSIGVVISLILLRWLASPISGTFKFRLSRKIIGSLGIAGILFSLPLYLYLSSELNRSSIAPSLFLFTASFVSVVFTYAAWKPKLVSRLLHRQSFRQWCSSRWCRREW
jgi:hypothetical protein